MRAATASPYTRCVPAWRARAASSRSTCWCRTSGRWRRHIAFPRKSSHACARWCRTSASWCTSSRSPTRPRTTTRSSTAESALSLVAGQDELDVVAAHVQERRRRHLPSAGLQLPYLCLGDGDEGARLGHEVADARTGHELDETTHAIGRGEDGDFCPLF